MKKKKGFLLKENGHSNRMRRKSQCGRKNWKRESHLRRHFESKEKTSPKAASKTSS